MDIFIAGDLHNESEETKDGVFVNKSHATKWYADRPDQGSHYLYAHVPFGRTSNHVGNILKE